MICLYDLQTIASNNPAFFSRFHECFECESELIIFADPEGADFLVPELFVEVGDGGIQ